MHCVNALLMRRKGRWARLAQQHFLENDTAPCLGLPQLLLARLLHMTGPQHQQLRLVCRRFREAFDSNVTHIATLPGFSPCPGVCGPPTPMHAPRIALQAACLQRLTLHCHRLGRRDVRRLAQLLSSGACNLSGLQELQLEMAPGGGSQPNRSAITAGLQVLLPALLLPRAKVWGLWLPAPAAQLHKLSLNSSYISPQGARQLAVVLLTATQLSTLQSLDLSHCNGMGAQGLAALAGVLQTASHLVGLREVSLAGLGRHDRNNAEHDDVTWPHALGALAAALLGGPFPQLRSLDLADAGLGYDGLERMAGALQASGTRPVQLQRLVLRRNIIPQHSMHALVHLLECWSPPSPAAPPAPSASSAATPPAALSSSTMQPVHLLELDLSDMAYKIRLGAHDILRLTSTAFAPCGALAGLRVLRLAGTFCTAATAVALASALEQPSCLPQLEILDLSRNSLGDEGMIRIAAVLQCAGRRAAAPLLELGLEHCGVRAAGALALASLLQGEAGRSLQRLDLSDNPLIAQGACALAAALQAGSGCPGGGGGAGGGGKLRRLGLRRIGCGNDGAAALAAALRGSTHLSELQALEVGGNNVYMAGLQPAFCQQLVEAVCSSMHLHSLRELRLTQLDYAAMLSAAAGLERATHLSTLCLLELHGIMANDEAVVCVALALAGGQQFKGLERLSLRAYGTSSTGFMRVFDRLCSSAHLAGLRDLELNLEGGGDAECMAALVRVLGSATHLVHLQKLDVAPMKDGRATVPAVAGMAAALHGNSCLRSLRKLKL